MRREATASPKKVVLLGIAALVAAYFWVPLVWGWMAKGDNAGATAAAGNASATAANPASAVPAAQPAAQATPDRPSWQEIAEWIRNDPRTMTAPALSSTRDPFEARTLKPVEVKVVEQPPPKPPPITPTAAGLVLTSTIVGPHRRVAQINGKTYAVGQTIEVRKEKEKGKESGAARFKVLEVDLRRAVLESDGQRFELSIPEPARSAKIEISKGS